MEVTTEVEFYINTVIDQDLPDAMTLNILQKATNKSNLMAKLKYCILNKRSLPKDPDIQMYKNVFDELTIAQQLVMRGDRIVLPEALIPDVLALAHEGHQGETKVKRYLHDHVCGFHVWINWWRSMSNHVTHVWQQHQALTLNRSNHHQCPMPHGKS